MFWEIRKKDLRDKTFLSFIYLNFLNLLDCIITISVVSYLGSTEVEANLIMRALIDTSPILFVLAKILGVFVISLWLYGKRDKKLARYGMNFLSIAYTFVVGFWIFCFACS